MHGQTHLSSLVFLLMVAAGFGCNDSRPGNTEGDAGRGSSAPEETPGEETNWTELAQQRLPMLEICQIGQLPEELLCGTLEVLEDRSSSGGRRIDLNLVVVPARHEAPPSEAIFVFEGGPGGAVTRRAGGSIFSGGVRQRDIVLVDQRGTGKSHPIDCDLESDVSDSQAGQLREMFPIESVARCADELAESANLVSYASADHADDIEEVRRRLGYGRVHLRGGSYGTRAMMVYAQRYPENVLTMFGIGVDSHLRSNLAERGLLAARTLDDFSELCSRIAECAELTPDFQSAVADLVARLDEGSLEVELSDPLAPEERLRIEVRRGWFTEQLRLALYFAFTSRALPWTVHRARDEGDWEPLLQLLVSNERSFKSSLSTGVLLTVQCSENMDFDVEEALIRGADTLFGNYRLQQQIAGCSAWPHVQRPALGVDDPQPLEVATLFLSGALDPVTPPEYAEDARKLFPNSLHVVLAEGHHGPFDLENGWDCVHSMWAELISQGSVHELDTSCSSSMHRPPFIADAASFEQYVMDDLAPMSGGA